MTRQEIAEKCAAIDRATERFVPLNEVNLADVRRRQSRPINSIPTFLPSWNRMSRGAGGGRGLGIGWYVVLAGATGAGKTIAGLNLTVSALRDGRNVLFVSLEMSHDELVSRLRPIVTGDDIRKLEPGEYWDEDLAAAADRTISDLPGTLHVNTVPLWELRDVQSMLEVFVRDEKVSLVIVDYAQLVSPAGNDQKLFEAMSTVSSTLRFQAQSLDIVVVALSQMNRATTRERNVPPTIEGLFGSSRFGFDANQVLALDYSKRTRDPIRRREKTRLLLMKNRHGPNGPIPIEIDFASFRISEIEKDERC